MIISREYIPFRMLKEINDPAYQIFRNAYVSSMGEERADDILNNLIERNQALCNREMGWCIPDVVSTLHDILEEILLKTGNATLAEASPYDRIWGIGLSADDPKAMNPDLWKGENLLGHALMRVRDELALESQMLEVADLGVHAGGDNDLDNYYVTPYQKREMDRLLKMVTGARNWKDGDILSHTNLRKGT